MSTQTPKPRRRSPRRQSNANETINTYFPIAKWVWSGAVVVAVSIGSALYYMKMDAELLKRDMMQKQNVDSEQSRQIKEQSQLLRDIHTQQLRAADALINLEKNITPSIESMNRSIDHAHKRIDEMIREKKSGN